ncbi:quinol:cytochrome C oxidoreductase [Myroides sp. LJL119]
MYTLSKNLKTFAMVLMVLGLVGIAYGFFSAPKTTAEVEQILTEQAHHDGDAHSSEHTGSVSQADQAAHEQHLEHVLSQLQNKPWAAVYTACIFVMFVSLGILAFQAINQAASAGWSPILFRVMEGLSAYLLPGSIIFFIILVISVLGGNHLFIWADPEVVANDVIIQGKTGYLNVPFFLIRAVVYLVGWNWYRLYLRKQSIGLCETGDLSFHKRIFKASALFLVFFIVSESMASWDWIMSIDTHWYSTLFGWYVFASFFVTAITTIAFATLYLKGQGHLKDVNTSHIHDLAKFMFGLSIFWTYLWFSQFMLQWYSNIPEEVTYFIFRIQEFNLPFFGMLLLNFALPLVLLINTDFKRLGWIIVMAGTCIIIGHYLDFFMMIMPGTVGGSWFIGVPEIGSLMFFIGLFIYVGFSTIAKAPLEIRNHPLMGESKHFHY